MRMISTIAVLGLLMAFGAEDADARGKWCKHMSPEECMKMKEEKMEAMKNCLEVLKEDKGDKEKCIEHLEKKMERMKKHHEMHKDGKKWGKKKGMKHRKGKKMMEDKKE